MTEDNGNSKLKPSHLLPLRYIQGMITSYSASINHVSISKFDSYICSWRRRFMENYAHHLLEFGPCARTSTSLLFLLLRPWRHAKNQNKPPINPITNDRDQWYMYWTTSGWSSSLRVLVEMIKKTHWVGKSAWRGWSGEDIFFVQMKGSSKLPIELSHA